jgi:glucose-1-phosphate thymidylyltransferase
MQGILLLGGSGSRMREATSGNKHLLPIDGRPMADYGAELLTRCGATEIIAVVTPHDEEAFRRVFAHSRWPVRRFVCQPRPTGTADALERCRSVISASIVLTLWGDNLFQYAPQHIVDGFADTTTACRIAVTEVDDPRPFSTVAIRDGLVLEVIDKPARPTTTTVCTGLMAFNPTALYRMLPFVPPNERGERDMMHVVRECLRAGTLGYERIRGTWFDAAVSPQTLRAANLFAHRYGFNHSPNETESSWTCPALRPLSGSTSTPPDAAS